MSESLTLSHILDNSRYRRGFSADAVYDTYMPKDILSSSFKFKRKGRSEYIIPSSQPLKFSEFSQEYLEEVWSRFSSSNFDEESLVYARPDLAYEIRKCFYALEFWSMTPGPKRYSREEILRCTLLQGPSYAERISDEWDYGIRRSHRVKGMWRDYEEWEPVVHYNELPPVGYLIRWEETSSDIEYMKIPLEPFDKELMEELRSEIMDALPSTLELPKDVEIFAEVKTSTSFDLEKGKNIPFYQARCKPEGSEFSQIFKAKRSIVPVGPANTRDAVVTTIDTYNSVKRCDLIMGTLLDDLDESLVHSSSQVFKKRLDEASRTPTRFGRQMYWLRDIKKCGLTFPRELIHLVQECLSETYPDKDFSSFNIYRNYSIYDESMQPIKTVRGYCLGMANNCITFIQCMIYRMLERRIPDVIEMTAFFGNDDSILKISSADGNDVDEFSAALIQQEDFDLLHGLNIITNDKKSFWSWYPIIFEEYGKPEFRKKDSRVACALSSAMLAPDIKYAKLLTSSISTVLWADGDWIVSPLRRLTEHWGYEYFPEEMKYDFTLGGWLSIKSKGCSLALRQIMDAPDEILEPLWVACRQIEQFQKEVIRPVLRGSVTKNYSVTGRILNITYVDTELYDIPKLPIEMIYLDEKGYKDFYESIYRFNRSPYKVMASRLRRVTASKIREDIQRMSIVEYMMSRDIVYAIPEQLVSRSTSIFEIDLDGRTDCNSLMRNCLSRYIEYLRQEKILTCTPIDIEPSGEYPYVQSFDRTPFTDKVNVVRELDGGYPFSNGIFQFSNNPWLPLSEYVKEYDRLPLAFIRLKEDREHLPIWFMTKLYKNSREISIAYNLIDYGEEFIDESLEEIRRIDRLLSDPEPQKESKVPHLCWTHEAGFCPWEQLDDIYNSIEEDCVLCILENQLWSARKRSTTALTISERYDAMRDVPLLRSRIKYLIEKYYPLLIGSLSLCLQDDEPNDLFAAINDSETEEDLFGGLGF